MQVSAASLADAGLTKDYIEKIKPVGVVRGATKARLPADGTACTGSQGGILAGKVARILPGSLELSGEVLSKNHALLSRF